MAKIVYFLKYISFKKTRQIFRTEFILGIYIQEFQNVLQGGLIRADKLRIS